MKPEPLRIALVLYIATTACGPTSNTDTGQASSSTTSVSGTTSSPGSTTGVVDPTTTTSATTTGPTSETGSPTSTGDSTFIVTPDGGSTCLASTDPGKPFRCTECDKFKQDCPRGQKCTAWASDGGSSWNASKCVDVTGDQVPGDECTAEGGGLSGIDDCEKGAMCWEVDKDTNMGTCVALCTGTPDAPVCDPGFACAIANDGVLNLCLPTCDPLLQDCPGDDLCIPLNDGFICVLDASGDMGKTNDPCEFPNACDKGLACSPTATASSACMQDATGCCQPFCDFSMMEPCPNPDQKCLQWFDPMLPIPPGLEDIGICAIPP
jgi:hypothetical protein